MFMIKVTIVYIYRKKYLNKTNIKMCYRVYVSRN